MREAGGLYVADWDDYFYKGFAHSGGRFQHKHLEVAMSMCKQKRLAIDAGAHVGSWARTMAEKFEHVYAFEPAADNFECLCKNVPDNVTPMPVALGADLDTGSMRWDSPTNGGAGYVVDGDDFPIIPLDACEFKEVDFIKFDIEGAEVDALNGAQSTLDEWRPVVLVELSPHNVRKHEWDAAGHWLARHDYRLVATMNRDYLFISAS